MQQEYSTFALGVYEVRIPRLVPSIIGILALISLLRIVVCHCSNHGPTSIVHHQIVYHVRVECWIGETLHFEASYRGAK